MRPAPFNYVAVHSIEEAVRYLSLYPGSKILAGGQSLIPLMKLRLVRPEYVIDVNGLITLSYIRASPTGLSIGALTRHAQIASYKTAERGLQCLIDSASVIADPQVRNRGTIGGSIAHADPAADYLPSLLVLNAEVDAVGPRGSRTIKIGELVKGPFETSLSGNEVITEVRCPKPPDGSSSAYLKLSKRLQDFAIVGVVAYIVADKDKCLEARIGIGGAVTKPVRAYEAEALLVDTRLGQSQIEKAAEEASEAISPVSNPHASVDYTTKMAKVMTKRVLLKAYEGLRKGSGTS
jgi:carbon-monoxide dehydrogenase medium subunit